MDYEKQQKAKKVNIIYKVVRDKFPIIASEIKRRWGIEKSQRKMDKAGELIMEYEVAKELEEYEKWVVSLVATKEDPSDKLPNVFPIWTDLSYRFKNMLVNLLNILNIECVVYKNVIKKKYRVVLYVGVGDELEEKTKEYARI